ncbi:T9SS type A sorting domain-containing protein [Echinicola marina]|uniref:T9SS type A sorting domain-containing protein n=1 Tax=Echinicola marina TaxID=2859768 RepID=UPI001CF62D44|nr:T9SS type A sorting domain-containing protein [Echinicola marina]UCS94501.1 T9SS type A sorting domain-containing protein [Echinicola marina]
MRILSLNTYAQSAGDYRTISSGDFDNVLIWEVYDGSQWVSAITKPGINAAVYIEDGHEVVLTQNEEIRSLYLNAQTGTGKKLNLNDFELDLYGSLNAYSGLAPGSSGGAWNTIDWIGSSEDSKLVFKGDSRVIIPSGAWSAFTTRSRYTVVFNANPGEVLRVQESIKANRFVLKSGKVLQEGIPGLDCASFSFNNDPALIGPYGDLVIEDGASLESDCSEGILFRSASGLVPASLLDLEEGGNLIFNANDPEINAATVHFDGTVYYASNSGIQNFVSTSMVGAILPETYNHLVFQGNAQKNLPTILEVAGNVEKVDGGNIVDNNTDLLISGSADQAVTGFALSVSNLEVNKSAGMLLLDNDLEITNDFKMIQGAIDFDNHDLYINSSGLGSYQYSDGSWHNLIRLHYSQIPIILNSTNATFPFVDKYEGGIRKVQLEGVHTALNSVLSITYQQIPGVDHHANFLDNDGTNILYQLNSYFTLNTGSSDNVDLILRISADDLIVDNVNDIRVVGDHIAAEGDHLAAEDDAGEFFARREVSLSEMDGGKFTVGSYVSASILPLNWLSYYARKDGEDNLLIWTVDEGQDIDSYRIYRSIMDVDKFELIGKIALENSHGNFSAYTFRDRVSSVYPQVYYQIGAVDKYGEIKFSPVFGLIREREYIHQIKIFPNPYRYGTLHIGVPENFYSKRVRIQIKDIQGINVGSFEGEYGNIQLSLKRKLQQLFPGIYILSFFTKDEVYTSKWMKK